MVMLGQDTRSLARLLVLLVAPTAATADESVFDRVTGTFGTIGFQPMACGVNPMQVGFSANRTRAHFKWAAPIVDYEGAWRTRADYTVISYDQTSIIMQLDGESRRDAEGAPVVWRYVVYDNGNTCWRDVTGGLSFCRSSYEPCADDPPIS